MADKIQQEIDNISKSIEKLGSKIENLKAELKSGDWGTQQLKELQAQLEKTEATLSRKMTKREGLVSKQDTQELDRLNKSIETLQRNIALGKGVRGLLQKDDPQFKKITEEIQKAERALSSFEARRQKRFDPITGKRLTDEQVQQKKLPITSKEDMERRLNYATIGINATNAEIEQQISRVRQRGQETLSKNPIGGAVSATTDTPRGRLVASTGDNTVVTAEDPMIGIMNGIKSSLVKDKDAVDRKTKADLKAAQKAEEEAKFRQDMRSRVQSDPKYRQALEQAGKIGLGIDDLQNVENRGGGIEQLLFANRQGGVNNKFRTYVNQFGGATPGLSSQFRSFGSDIARDIGQFAKWSIAVAAIYTPMQKLGELITVMVDNESKLADATIAANVSFDKAGEIFDRSGKSAYDAGESIGGVIDAYAQAIRAAGRYSTETEKTQKATALLNDSLILSKLSALDQASAIDTLSAALLQSGMELDQGEKLLNKWVRVSQVANVTIDTLATGVAVLGDAAETAGLSIDEMNGLIAVLAENSISGSKEAANTAKALIGAYQSDKAEAALNKYGIALRKTNGDVRDFLDIYRDLAKLRAQGVLSEASVSELALALGGGGVRRAKDASALINSQERLNQVAEESRKISEGSTLAEDSLAKKLETVQTANTRLANSFQELAQTLGDEGGILDNFKTLLNLMTGVTKAADGLFSVMGRSGPTLVAFSAALLALRNISPGKRDTMLGMLGVTPGTMYGGANTYGKGAGYAKGLAGDLLQMNYRGAGVLGGAGVAIAGVQNLAQGKNEQALGNVVGGVIGAAIGAYLGGPPGLAIGANIGSAAGESIITALTNYAPEWQNLFTPPEPGAGGGTEKTIQTEQQKVLEELVAKTREPGWLAQIDAAVIRAFPNFGGAASKYGGTEYSRSKMTAEQVQLYQLPEEERKRLTEQANKLNQRNQIRAGQFTPAEDANYEGLRKQLEQMATKEKEIQLQKLAQGDITPAAYGRVSNQLTGFPAVAIQSVGAYGEQFKTLSKDINSTQDAYEAFLYIATNGTEDQIAELSKYSTDIRTLQNIIDTWEPGDVGLKLELSFGDVTAKSPEQLKAILAGIQQDAAAVANRTLLNVQISQKKLPPIMGSYTEATTQGDNQMIISEGLKIQEKYLKESGQYTQEQMKEIISQIEPFSVYVTDAGKMFYDTVEGLNQWAYDAAKKNLEEMGKLSAEKGIGFQKFDIPMSQLEQLAGQSLSIGQSWQQKYNYDFKPEDQIAIDQQGIVNPLHADFKILALLLQDLNDKAQKQLDGQYNIPEGATFWVPLTAAYYRNKSTDSGLGNDFNLQGMDTNTNATNANTRALEQLSSVMTNTDRLKLEYPNTSKATTYDEFGVAKRADPSNRGLGGNNAALGYRGDMGYSRTVTPASTSAGTSLQQFMDLFKNGLTGLLGTTINDRMPKAGALGAQNNAPVTPTQKLDLKISSNINLMVDGRVLASTMQSYLASELLRTEQSQGTITKRYVI